MGKNNLRPFPFLCTDETDVSTIEMWLYMYGYVFVNTAHANY